MGLVRLKINRDIFSCINTSMKKSGIDQSYTKTAIVILNDDYLDNFVILSSDKDMDIFTRCWDLTNKISEFVLLHKPDNINIEGISFGSRGDQTRNLSGLQFSIINRLRFVDKFSNINLIAPTTLKKFATGNGRSDKKLMIEALPPDVLDRFKDAGYKRANGLEDLADAYWLAKYSKN